jgi:(p)ppGpp synthase/HD superfamily hydrolase
MEENLAWKARLFAFKKHAGQMYGEEGYDYHLNMVAGSVCDAGESESVIAVAYLHDIIEDTDVTDGDLINLFGYEIADAVMALTKVKGEKYSQYLDKVAANQTALTVKMHDTLSNLRESVKTRQWGRVKKYSEQLKLLAIYK